MVCSIIPVIYIFFVYRLPTLTTTSLCYNLLDTMYKHAFTWVVCLLRHTFVAL